MEFMDVDKDGKIDLGYVTFYNTRGLVSCGQYAELSSLVINGSTECADISCVNDSY
ncbi:hypothetical protein DPMN_102912 [Dreissena polymorpha]|uniref:Uncharacterized protein n=1 Tax=Dreissena polymorpha TaxID=45954 RepID=A0A9D4K0A7_DREPO|nr:hypothetical protein DPMN_102912 [Dreissena polymorpha]